MEIIIVLGIAFYIFGKEEAEKMSEEASLDRSFF